MEIRTINNEDAYIIVDDDFEERVFPRHDENNNEISFYDDIISVYKRRGLNVAYNIACWIARQNPEYNVIDNLNKTYKSTTVNKSIIKYKEDIEKYLMLI